LRKRKKKEGKKGGISGKPTEEGKRKVDKKEKGEEDATISRRLSFPI